MIAVVALCGQGLVYALHIDRVLSREDTRNLTRDWMVENTPLRARIVIEPVVPDAWAQDIGESFPVTPNGNRWIKFPTARSTRANDGTILPPPGRLVNIEDYERTLYPDLIDRSSASATVGSCRLDAAWARRGTAERRAGRARVLPRLPDALDGRPPGLAVRAGEDPVKFNFDWTFDFYPLAYTRPGPVMPIHRLQGGEGALPRDTEPPAGVAATYAAARPC